MMSEVWAAIGRAVLDHNYFTQIQTEAAKPNGIEAVGDWIVSQDGGYLRLTRIEVADLTYALQQPIKYVCLGISSMWKGNPPDFSIPSPLALRHDVETCSAIGLACFDRDYFQALVAACTNPGSLKNFLLTGSPRFFVDDPGSDAIYHLVTTNTVALEVATEDFEKISWRKPDGDSSLLGRCDLGHKLSGTRYTRIPQPVLEAYLGQNPEFIKNFNFLGTDQGPRVAL